MMIKRTHKLQSRLSVKYFSTENNNSEAPKIDKCLYKTLSVDADANAKDIREAYLQKARDYHPDRRPDCLEYFTHCTKAYEVLSDQHKRAVYDDEQITDEDFFTMQVGPLRVNMLAVMFGVAVVGVGYLGYIKMNQSSKEGACPINHS